MNFQELLKDKKMLMIAGGVVAIVLALILMVGIISVSKGGGAKSGVVVEKKIKDPLVLLTTDNIGKALEIQSLLARQGIEVRRRVDGTKSELFLINYTMSQRDVALMTIVKSGLMDQNVGLEVFDKGDFTSTREDKRIRLARAMNGELARLIKKLDNVENAAVFISIPEQTMFSQLQKPTTAAVQVTLGHKVVRPDGTVLDVATKLDRSDVKAITNLLMGAVPGLEQENITISDTEGNVYASLASADDQLAKIEENDNYMKSKVQIQLDRLVGKGNYSVSVSTFLTQAPTERTTIGYDPKSKTAISEQSFSEGLGDQTRDTNQGLNAVSAYLPNGLPNGSASSAQNRSYSRTAKEVQYGVSKIQESEYVKKGVIEDISIAVTLDEQYMPQNISLQELKELVARAASPKVSADNVTIAFSDSLSPKLVGEQGKKQGAGDYHSNPWWLAVVLIVVGLLVGLKLLSNKISGEQKKSQKELEALRGKSAEQEKQLREINLKAAELIEKQSQLAQAQSLLEQQQIQPQITQQQTPQIPIPESVQETEPIGDTLSEISSDMEDADEDDMVDKVMSWIEKP